MIYYTRRILAVLFLIWGFASAIYALLSASQVWGALGLIAAGIAIATYLFPEDMEWTKPSLLSRWAVGAFTAISFIAYFAETDAFKPQRTPMAQELTFVFANVVAGAMGQITSEERRIASKGMVDCAITPDSDLGEAAKGSLKTIYFGPTLSLLDFAFSRPPAINPNACVEDYLVLKTTRQAFFKDVERKYSAYLKSAAQALRPQIVRDSYENNGM